MFNLIRSDQHLNLKNTSTVGQFVGFPTVGVHYDTLIPMSINVIFFFLSNLLQVFSEYAKFNKYITGDKSLNSKASK